MALIDILGQLTTDTVVFLPNLLAAAILLVIGLVVGKVIGRVVKEVLVRMKLDYYITETHKPPISAAELFSVIAKWWIYLGFVTAALSREVLGVTALSLWVAEINAFIPRIIGASLIVVVGYVLGEYIKSHIRKTESLYGILVGKLLFFFIMYVSIALALPTLGIGATLVNNILLVIIVAVGLGFALAMGLGMKEAIADVSKRYVRHLKV